MKTLKTLVVILSLLLILVTKYAYFGYEEIDSITFDKNRLTYKIKNQQANLTKIKNRNEQIEYLEEQVSYLECGIAECTTLRLEYERKYGKR